MAAMDYDAAARLALIVEAEAGVARALRKRRDPGRRQPTLELAPVKNNFAFRSPKHWRIV